MAKEYGLQIERGLSWVWKVKLFLSLKVIFSWNTIDLWSANISVEGGNGYVKLKELLVEESWLKALSEEFDKPYAENLCKFVETEICGGQVPIYPPPYLIFNALNSTPFDKVKAIILGQVLCNCWLLISFDTILLYYCMCDSPIHTSVQHDTYKLYRNTMLYLWVFLPLYT